MFESNVDIELDKIFDDDLQPNPVINIKRAIENELCLEKANKKLCLGNNTCASSTAVSGNIKISALRPKTLAKSPNKKVVLRKFPGPAGLLPERGGFNADIKGLKVGDRESEQNNSEDMDICSQMSVKAFHEGPWDRMSTDFHSNNSSLFLPDKYNIAWIKDKVKNNKLINKKAPFVAAIIQNIECSKSQTAVVTMLLKDATGQIHGTIIYDLYEEYINELKVGSVIVLKQFGVLTTDRGCNVYVTITTNNLVAIYSNSFDCTENFKVKVTTIQKFSIDDFIKNINEVKMRHKSVERLQSIMSFSETNLNVKSIPKPHFQHINNKYNTPIKSRSTGDIANIDRFKSNLLPLRIVNPMSSPHVNKVNDTHVNSNSNAKTKFNFKAVKCDNSKVIESPISKNANVAFNNDKNRHSIKDSQISTVTNESIENNLILQNIFEGVDTNLLFEDF